MAGFKAMSSGALATVTLAVLSLVGIAVLTGFKTTGQVDNDVADDFIDGLAIFGTFMAIITLTLVGKIIIGLVKSEE